MKYTFWQDNSYSKHISYIYNVNSKVYYLFNNGETAWMQTDYTKNWKNSEFKISGSKVSPQHTKIFIKTIFETRLTYDK